MGFERFFQGSAEWIAARGPRADIVLSTRIRLARNFAGLNFGTHCTPAMKERVLEYGTEILARSEQFKGGVLLRLAHLTPLQRQLCVERHLLSPALIEAPEFVGLVVDGNEMASAVLNEEDHLRLQVIQGGFTPQLVWQVIDTLDDDLAGFLPYSYSDRWGYLTACPTNTGTGMRVSVLIHLPALVLTREITKVLRAIGQVDLVVRGFYGEGSDVLGNLFQISNQRTLGVSETELVERLERITNEVIRYEERAREKLLSGRKRARLEDQVWRAVGELKSARLLTSNEVITLTSVVRLGLGIDLMEGIDLQVLNEIVLLAQPAHLQLAAGRELGAEERDRRRSRSVQEKLADFHL
jgi:protein arginine kinase